VIPIVISIAANKEKRSRSRWNPYSRSLGIVVHDAPDTAFTFDRNNQLVELDKSQITVIVCETQPSRSGWQLPIYHKKDYAKCAP
jgi:hypothetical protein